jgi:hypothetical protein
MSPQLDSQPLKDEVDCLHLNQSNALVQLSEEGETGSINHRAKTRVQDDVIKFLLANLPNLTDLVLVYPAPGEIILDVAFSKPQHLSVTPQESGCEHVNIATVAHFLGLPNPDQLLRRVIFGCWRFRVLVQPAVEIWEYGSSVCRTAAVNASVPVELVSIFEDC